MLKSPSKGRIPVLKNGAEGEKPKAEAPSKSPSARPKLFGSKKSDKSKEPDKTKAKSDKSKGKDDKSKDKQKMEEIRKQKMEELRRQKVEEQKEKERQKKLKKEKEKVKSEKDKKKLFKPTERTQSKLVNILKPSKPVSPPTKNQRSPEATVKLHYIPQEDDPRLTEEAGVYYPESLTPSPNESQYDIVGTPFKKGDNFLLKYQIKGDYLERQEANQGSSSSSETQPTPDSVHSFNPSKSENSEKGDNSKESNSPDNKHVDTLSETNSDVQTKDSNSVKPEQTFDAAPKELSPDEKVSETSGSFSEFPSPKRNQEWYNSEIYDHVSGGQPSPKRLVKSDAGENYYSDASERSSSGHSSPRKTVKAYQDPYHSDASDRGSTGHPSPKRQVKTGYYSDTSDKLSSGTPSPKKLVRTDRGDYYYSDNSDRSSSGGQPSPKRRPKGAYPVENPVYEVVQHIPTYQPVEVMSDDPEQKYDEVGYGECPRSPSARSDPGVLEDTPAKPHRIRYGPGRRQVPRRHTLGADLMGDSDYEDPEDKRAAFMELLANRYPAYADRIYSGTGTQSEIAYPLKSTRTRDPRRRQTTIVTYHPNRSVDYEDSMSDIDAANNSFSRGGFQRSSLPIVRTASSTLERTLGLAFLVFGNETKKCLLPNEITTLDTVRALFVHHFPEKLTFRFLESPRQKIYILDPKTNIFFQLDDLSEIKDRTVLRIHECDSDKPQKLKEQPKIRGRAISAPPVRHYDPRHTDTIPPRTRDDAAMQPYHTYQIDGDPRTVWDAERRSRSRSRTPDPERPKSLPNRSRYSPDRHSTPERGLLGTIPEHHQMQNGRAAQNGGHYDAVYYPRGQSQPTSPTRQSQSRPFSPTTTSYENPYYGYHGPPPSDYYPQHNGVPKPKRQAANVPPQYAIPPQHPDMRSNGSRHPNRHSLAFAPMTTGRPPPAPENYYQQLPPRHRPVNEDDAFSQPRSATPVPEYYHSRKRIDKMEEQLANLAAWVHKSATDSLGRQSTRSMSSNASESSETLPISSSSSLSGMSDTGSGSSQRTIVTCSKEMKLSMVAIQEKTYNLRLELRGLRRAQQVNYEDICEAIADTLYRIKKVLTATPGADCQLIRQQRYDMDSSCSAYIFDQNRLENELGDLEHSVEELRNDVVTRQCRVQMSDIESMALLLSNITKAIADLKTRFPQLQDKLKAVMSGEMEVVVKEEKFLNEEPDRIDSSLKRCKKLTGTLYTLKRLASVQDHRPLNVPALANKVAEPSSEEKYGVLENIRAIVPNHTTRLNSLEEAESSRERKKKIIQQKESLKFGKSLELAHKSLKPAEAKSEPTVSLSGYKINNIPLTVGTQGYGSLPIYSASSDAHISRPSSTNGNFPTSSSGNQGYGSIPVTTSSEGYSYGLASSSKVLPIQSQAAHFPPAPQLPPAYQQEKSSAEKPQSIPIMTMSVPVSPKTTANPEVLEMNNQKQAARAAFFSSMSSPETSPNGPIAPSSISPARTMDYVVKFSPAQISSIKANADTVSTSSSGPTFTTYHSITTPTSPTETLPTGGLPISSLSPSTKDQPSPTSKSGSSIPRPASKTSPSQDRHATKQDCDLPVKGKKPPPPPPPRKSSRLPLGHTINGTVSPVRAFSPDGTAAEIKPSNGDSKPSILYSSTPKPLPPKKPVSKFHKDIVAGIYANMNRPDLQSQKSPPQNNELPSRAETKTNVLSDREGSSDSTSSSASLDSQLGAAVFRDSEMTSSNGSLGKKRKSKPNPPQRRSSLLSKSPTHDSKTMLLHDQTKMLNDLQQQQTMLIQQHNDLVRSANTPPQTLPKPTSPVSPTNGKK